MGHHPPAGPDDARRGSLRDAASAQPGVELFTGLFAMLVGGGIASGLLASREDVVLSLLPLVFVAYGVVHIVMFAGVGRRERTE